MVAIVHLEATKAGEEADISDKGLKNLNLNNKIVNNSEKYRWA